MAAARALLRSATVSQGPSDDGARDKAGASGGRRRGDSDRPRSVLAADGWLPKALLAAGLALEVVGVVLAATTRAWTPAAVLFGTGAVGGLAGLHGWVGGWVRAQEG